MERLWQDVHFGVRTLWKTPGFIAAAVLTLALGIGANTAIFSVVHGVVLAPLPFRQPDRLVTLWQSRPDVKRESVSWLDFRDWQRNAQSFERMAAVIWENYDLIAPGTPEHVAGMEVSSGFFTTLGVRLLMGHDFSSSEDQPHAAPESIISDRLWKERFASSPQILGKSIILDGTDYTVVGVLPRGFQFWTKAADGLSTLFSPSPLFPESIQRSAR